jgi:hypothetical protein
VSFDRQVELSDHLPPFFAGFPPLARLDLLAPGVGLPLFILSCACLLEGALVPLVPLEALPADPFLIGIIISFRFVIYHLRWLN